MRTLGAAGIAGAALLVALPALAGAADQTIDATVETSISVSLSDPAVSTTLADGANEFPGGTLTVDSDVLTDVTVSFNKTALTAYDSAAGTYDDTTQLSTFLTLEAVDLADSTNTGTATSDTGGTLISLASLGTSQFDLTYVQPVDTSLDEHGAYRIVTTFEVGADL